MTKKSSKGSGASPKGGRPGPSWLAIRPGFEHLVGVHDNRYPQTEPDLDEKNLERELDVYIRCS
jgi:hypothetical protein